jgi:hypothetical protein
MLNNTITDQDRFTNYHIPWDSKVELIFSMSLWHNGKLTMIGFVSSA